MAGLYVHIPFCKRRCNYCDFYSTTEVGLADEYMKCLRNELIARRQELEGRLVETIYFGGGTPSQIDVCKLSEFMDYVSSEFVISPNAEVTMELNPDDVSEELVAQMKRSRFNRVSIGIQSFHDDDLVLLDRRHNSDEALAAIRKIQDAGIKNISLDLMYGIPDLSYDKWAYNLDVVSQLEIQHLSAYSLSYYENTKITELSKNKIVTPATEDDYALQFYMLTNWAEKNNFDHYELANLAKQGYQSKHNSSYWKGAPYVGLGASAHSYNGTNIRSSNSTSLSEYLKKKGDCQSVEKLSLVDRYNEYVLCLSRTMWGIDANYVLEFFGKDLHKRLMKKLEKLLKKQLLVGNQLSPYVPTKKGYLLSNIIAEELMEI
ncbi:MAG: radical SAM family heme chaperone HemW [Bacteroidales bacterium]